MAANHVVKELLIFLFMVSLSAGNSDDLARDSLDHVLRIPNPEKILNSVLGRLERNRQQGLNRPRLTEEPCSESLPEYTESLQTSRERGLRQLGIQKGNAYWPDIDQIKRAGINNKPVTVHCWAVPFNMQKVSGRAKRLCKVSGVFNKHPVGRQKHYPICHLERKIKKLNTNEYEYRPAYYEEVRCSTLSGEDEDDTNEICSSLGFSCVQWNKTIHLTRRRYTSNCWETRTIVIPAGCECMWPVHKLGDMKLHV